MTANVVAFPKPERREKASKNGLSRKTALTAKSPLKTTKPLKSNSTLQTKANLKTKTLLKAKAPKPKTEPIVQKLPKPRRGAKSASTTEGLALVKHTRLVDQKAIASIRKPFCEVCGKPAHGEPHHIVTRGSGGPDHRFNLIQLCFHCHYEKVPAGDYSKEYLFGIVAAREGLPVTQIVNQVAKLRGRPQGAAEKA